MSEPSTQTVALHDGRTVRLGRKRPRARPPALAFSAYFDPGALSTPLPAALDYYTRAMPAIKRMYDNDTYGCCVIASLMHQIGVWSGNDSDSGGLVQATDAEVLAQYQGICGPGDQGCEITAVLDYAQAHGVVAGGKTYKIDGYVSIDWRNKTALQVAVLLFGGVKFGVNLPQAWHQAPENGLWDVTSSRIIGGHDVPGLGWTASGIVIATWGGLRTITWAALARTTWVEECYVPLAPLWYGMDLIAPCGVNATKLRADLALLHGGTIPPIDPTPIPPPAPPPPPPAPPPVPPVPPAPGTLTGDEAMAQVAAIAGQWVPARR